MSLFPEEKRQAVNKALHAAFGSAAIEEIRPIPQGLSSDLVYRIEVKGRRYQLRLMTRMDERLDPTRIFACMIAASEADLAPQVHYSSAEDGIAITDHVEPKSLAAAQALTLLPANLRRLHAMPPFPKAFNYVTPHNLFIWRFRKAGLVPPNEVESVFNGYDELCSVYPRIDSDWVSSHMDLKPENILFDGRRVWLTGWQAALLNDRYFDLAVAANFVVTNEADESSYLNEYFGQPTDDYRRARFFLMRQVVHMLSATIFLLLGTAGQPISPPPTERSFTDFHSRVWKGAVDLTTNDQKILYGLVHWNRLRENVQTSRFHEALEIISEANRAGVPRLLPAALRE